MAPSLRELMASTPLSGGNAPYVEALYEQFLSDPGKVEPAWRDYFHRLQDGHKLQDGLKSSNVATGDQIHSAVQAAIVQRAARPRLAAAAPGTLTSDAAAKQGAVSRLVQIYSNRGHLVANLDPLGLQKRERPRVLELGYFGLTDADLDTEFLTGSRPSELAPKLKLRELIANLEYAYCGTIGAEFAHVSNTDERLWLQDQYLTGRLKGKLSADEQKNILAQLSAAEGLERYLHTKYVGQKRFSLEGGDALIPLLDDLIQVGGQKGIEECVIGMAHRGRLNVLVNVLGKSPSVLFSEFEGKYDTAHMQGSGDVKYHKGFSSDLRTPGGNVHVALAFNPSHLEVVNPVVEGSVRARQERRGDTEGTRVLPILIHGDAAFAGQGVVMETLQLSQARAFFTGGSVHIIINNQVGFTTSDPRDARSTMYCSDVAKMLETPIFHVNGDDPEAVVFVTRLALAYRQHFHKDVVIDLVCYRRHGHNEADEPAATQPTMYQVIRKQPTTRKLYADKLVAQGLITDADAAAMTESYRQGLDEGRPQARASLGMIGNKYTVDWSKYLGNDWSERVKGGGNMARLKALGARIVSYPENFALHPRVAQVMTNRVKMMAGELPLDWGCAETLAYASILEEGNAIRFTGQDAGRGTFFHRHAVLHEQSTGQRYIPLQHIAERQPSFQITDSVLSEEAVLGFEYGYSTTDPSALVIWEGQFGDFVNGAQVIIDQFISSGEAKWGRLCGLALFLPHGYEGQGPEHSSARLERFLQLCAENNMQVCVPSTPAQMYHMTRRQILRSLRKPLIVMTPKSLLRHELAVSTLEDLANGEFETVIDEIDKVTPANVRRVVLSSGKVYFDLLKARRAQNANKDTIDVALVRVEQLYPFPMPEMEAVLAKYPNAREVVWCQEEPQNQGAWYQIRHRLATLVGKRELLYAGRAPAAAPATGISKIHEAEQRGLIEAALTATDKEDGARETKRLMTTQAPAAAATSR